MNTFFFNVFKLFVCLAKTISQYFTFYMNCLYSKIAGTRLAPDRRRVLMGTFPRIFKSIIFFCCDTKFHRFLIYRKKQDSFSIQPIASYFEVD